jgi:hypothetical protein
MLFDAIPAPSNKGCAAVDSAGYDHTMTGQLRAGIVSGTPDVGIQAVFAVR